MCPNPTKALSSNESKPHWSVHDSGQTPMVCPWQLNCREFLNPLVIPFTQWRKPGLKCALQHTWVQIPFGTMIDMEILKSWDTPDRTASIWMLNSPITTGGGDFNTTPMTNSISSGREVFERWGRKCTNWILVLSQKHTFKLFRSEETYFNYLKWLHLYELKPVVFHCLTSI